MADGRKLKSALKKQVKRQKPDGLVKRPKVVVTSCLGICPKRAVTVASAATLQRGEYLLLSDCEQAADAVKALMGSGTT